MVITENKGDVILKYNSEDYDIKKENKSNMIWVPLMVIAFLLAIVLTVAISMYLEKLEVNDGIIVMVMAIMICGAFLAIVLWCVYGIHRNCIPAYTTIDWLNRCKKMEAGYYKGEIRIRMHFSNGPCYKSIAYVLDSVKNEHIIDESKVKDKGGDITVTFDFTNSKETLVTVENKETE